MGSASRVSEGSLVEHLLRSDEVRQFQDNGYVGPFTLCSPHEMSATRDRIDREVFTTRGPAGAWSGAEGQSRHIDHRVIYDLCAHPAIVGRMASVYGRDLVLWRSHFFVKESGAPEIPWHQDVNYWPIEPPVNISAWIAIDDSTVANACLQVVPGSHRAVVPHVPADESMLFDEMADPALIDVSGAVDLEMRAGEFILFNERTLHHSEPNRSEMRRVGLAVRVTVPFVKVGELFPGHGVMVLSGEDQLGFNRVLTPPDADR